MPMGLLCMPTLFSQEAQLPNHTPESIIVGTPVQSLTSMHTINRLMEGKSSTLSSIISV
jgi:hypothetical protein